MGCSSLRERPKSQIFATFTAISEGLLGSRLESSTLRLLRSRWIIFWLDRYTIPEGWAEKNNERNRERWNDERKRKKKTCHPRVKLVKRKSGKLMRDAAISTTDQGRFRWLYVGPTATAGADSNERGSGAQMRTCARIRARHLFKWMLYFLIPPTYYVWAVKKMKETSTISKLRGHKVLSISSKRSADMLVLKQIYWR